jgi:hypothetical protein
VSSFTINLSLPKIEEYARAHGFLGAAWKRQVLEDLLFDGRLHVKGGRDPRSGDSVWHCMGRRCSVTCVPDRQKDYSLFCIGLVAGPAEGGPSATNSVVDVPGPWELDTFGRRQGPGIRVEEHMNRCLGDVAPMPAKSVKRGAFGALADFHMTSAVVRRRVQPDEMVLAGAPISSQPHASGGPPDTADESGSAYQAIDRPRGLEVGSTATVVMDEGSDVRFDHGDVSTEPPRPDLVGVPGEAAPGSSWRLLPPRESWRELVVELVAEGAPTLIALLSAADPVAARRARIEQLEESMARLREELEALPDESVVMAGAERVAAVVEAAGGLHVPARLGAGSVDQLHEVLAALGDAACQVLPKWVLGVSLTESESLSAVLADEALQLQLARARQWMLRTFGGAPPDGFSLVGEPTSTGTVEDRLAAAWQSEALVRGYGDKLDLPTLAILRGMPSSDAAGVAERLIAWREDLHPDAFADLLAKLTGSMSVLRDPGVLLRLEGEDREIVRDLRTWARVCWHLDRAARVESPVAVARPLAGTESASVPSGAPPRLLDFDHVVTDERGHVHSARLFVPEPQDGRPVFVEIPVRLIASGPMDRAITVDVRSAAMVGVPASEVRGRAVTVSYDGQRPIARWRVSHAPARWLEASDQRWYREEVLSLPLTAGEANRIRDGKVTRVSVALVDSGVDRSLTFERFERELPNLAGGTGLGDSTATEIIQQRPLGAQVQHQKLASVVEEGRQTFMVVAPRRFGKTTLFQHLAEVARQAGHVVAAISMVRDESSAESATKFWAELKRALERDFKAAPPLGDRLPASVLDEEAWTKVRQFVARQGRSSLVVLVDEAQALVPRTGGPRWGTEFKLLVELGLVERKIDLARVQIGLFGTVDLSVRVGQNCKDFLLMHGTEIHAFDEASLGRYLRAVGGERVGTTRHARQTLARWTNNLRTLSTVYDHLRRRIATIQRSFLLDLDVDACVEELLSAGGRNDDEVWTYARSEMSHQDSWDPIDGFPLAVAWAQHRGTPNALARMQLCQESLQEELRVAGAPTQLSRARMEAALRDLKARGVLRDDGEFARPLLGELLRLRPHILRDDPVNQLALMRLAVDEIDWPEEAEQRDEGGQARIFVSPSEGVHLTYRACRLESDEDQRRFARTCAAVRTLRDRQTRLDGDEFLPRVRKAGFRSDDSRTGLLVYEWVEGESLAEQWKVMTGPARMWVVNQVARAVGALHAREVLHCDIAPRNVIVNGRLHATLIDFGLSRTTDTESRTRFPSDSFRAPEQCSEFPVSEKASDIFSLGTMLWGPGDGTDLPGPVREIANRMRAVGMESRPSIDEVVGVLNDQPTFDTRLHTAKSVVEDVIQDADDRLWPVLLEVSMAAALGQNRDLAWGDGRAMELAFTLNRLFEIVVREGLSPVARKLRDHLENIDRLREISLNALEFQVRDAKEATFAPFQDRSLKIVGLLRVAWAHPSSRSENLTRTTQMLQSKGDLAARALAPLRETARRLDHWSGHQGNPIERFAGMFAGQNWTGR